MKFIHISDLHLGKRLNEFSMIEDQSYVLKSILKVCIEQRADAVIIAGDVYDKSVPSAEAMSLFDKFLVELAKNKIKVFVISGNHDSSERIAFGSRLMDASGVYMSPTFDGKIQPITATDEYGEINIYMLPFIKPVNVRKYYGEDIISYNDAIKAVVEDMQINESERNLLITHQFITGAKRSESEEISVGGTDNVDAELLSKFDYVALGHIHSPQSCGREYIRYCGTPLKYSFSEAKDEKSITVVEFKKKGEVKISLIPLKPMRDMVEIKGKYEQITLKSFYENTSWREDYAHITLTDEEDVPDAVAKLRTIYKNLMRLDYDNARTRQDNQVGDADVENKSPLELFEEFYELQNNQPLNEEQKRLMERFIKEIWEEAE